MSNNGALFIDNGTNLNFSNNFAVTNQASFDVFGDTSIAAPTSNNSCSLLNELDFTSTSHSIKKTLFFQQAHVQPVVVTTTATTPTSAKLPNTWEDLKGK